MWAKSAPFSPMNKPPIDEDRPALRLLRAVGNSPLLRIALPDLPGGARLFAKLESTHPGGSLKDRPVARLLLEALDDGRLEGRRWLDVTGVTAGISYAVHAAALGVPLTLILPADSPKEFIDRIVAHGAEVVLVEGNLSVSGKAEAQRLLGRSPERFHYGGLATSEESWQAHYDSTGHEILTQVFEASGTVPEAFVMGVGSGATLMGVARRLLRRRSDLAILAVEPAPGETLPGLLPIDDRQDPFPAWFDVSLLAGRISIHAEDAFATCRELALQGLFVGPSSGAHVFAAATLLRQGRFGTVVTVLCDGGERYGSRDATPVASKRRSRG